MDDLRCCLADFGLSLLAESQTLNSSSKMRGSIRWLAPEYIDSKAVIDQAYITARDIYAYGCTVVEVGPVAYYIALLSHSSKMLTGQPPFSDIKNDAGVVHAVMNRSRPLPPRHLLQDGLWSLVTMCLITSPSRRPTAEWVARALADHCREEIEEGGITAYKDVYAIFKGLVRDLSSYSVRSCMKPFKPLGWVVLVSDVETLLNLLHAYLRLKLAVMGIFVTCLVSVVVFLASSYEYWMFISLFFLMKSVNIVEYPLP